MDLDDREVVLLRESLENTMECLYNDLDEELVDEKDTMDQLSELEELLEKLKG